MKPYKQIHRTCKHCLTKYFTMPSKNKIFCSNKCFREYRKGKTLIEIFGEKTAKKIHDNLVLTNTGRPSPRKGTKCSEESRKKMSESQKGRISFMKGKHHSLSSRKIMCESQKKRFEKQPVWNKGKKASQDYRRKMREGRIRYIEKLKNNGLRIHPTIGKNETKILDTLENIFNYPIIRQYNVRGFYVDGFCPALNLMIEIDEKNHKYKIEKDTEREKEIKKFTGCNFLRIKEPNLIEVEEV